MHSYPSAARHQIRFLPTGLALVLSLIAAGEKHPALAGDTELFESVKSLLERKCLGCHNSLDRKGDFSLQERSELLESGMLEPGNPGSSYLLDVIQPDGDSPPQMPRDAEPLDARQVTLIRDWIDAGAPWPNGASLSEPLVDDYDWWSLKPVIRPPVPGKATPVGDDDRRFEEWPRTPIDQFILELLRERDLAPSRPADRRTLIRRLTYDLTGLPPSPAQIEAFAADALPGAYERLVDRLLASPHYGERWGRHWLDVVKYADTCGYDKDKLRPNAWPYRDYVIRSFNDDKPYARFVREQIAGDVLYPDHPDGILGLGFIAAGPWDFIGHVEVPESKIDGKVARNLDRDEMVSNTFNTFCSVTVQCARCHNHKFDPITQADYYGLQSIFAAIDRAERPYDLDPEIERRRRELAAEIRSSQERLKEIRQEIREEGGERLAAVEQRLTELKPKTAPQTVPETAGYHSKTEKSPDVTKWVQVDLGREVALSRVVLHPAYADFNGIGSGFGFPVRFRVEAADDQSAFDSDAAVSLADHTDHDVPNPLLMPYVIDAAGVRARYLRVTATKLASRLDDDYIFVLAELTVENADGEGVSEGAEVTALDSIEAPVSWARENLTDGKWGTPADRSASEEFVRVSRERDAIRTSLETPLRVREQEKLSQAIVSAEASLKQLPRGRMVYAAATHFEPQANFKPRRGSPREVAVLHRGNVQQPREPAQPGALPLVNGDDPTFELPGDHGEGDRRAALAVWLTDPNNPLVWRSIVNRIWLHHFGRGLVSTPNDFGRMGQQPSHPELLDWLAAEFRESGGSIKHLHRLIVTSAVYRQSSPQRQDAAQIDGGNRYLWKMNRRRLSAEEIRDAILKVSGRLNSEMGGPGYYLFELEKPEHSPHYEYHKHDPRDPVSHRRAVYRFVVRSQPDPWMTTLDCADSSQSTPQRDETLTSLQALSLLNNRFNLAMAEDFAQHLQQEADHVDGQARLAVHLVTGRRWADDELQEVTAYARRYGLPNLCRLLFNLSEFVYID